MAKQVKKWITINGNHVPVYEDGSLGGFMEGKQASSKESNEKINREDSYSKTDKPHKVTVERQGEKVQFDSYGEGWEEGYHVEHTDYVGGKYIDQGKVGDYEVGEKVNYKYADSDKPKPGTIVMAHKYPNGKVDYTVVDDKDGDGHSIFASNLSKQGDTSVKVGGKDDKKDTLKSTDLSSSGKSKPSLNDIKGYGYDPHDATGDPTIITADGRSYYKIGDDKWVAHSDSGRTLSGSISDKQMAERLSNAKDIKVNPAASDIDSGRAKKTVIDPLGNRSTPKVDNKESDYIISQNSEGQELKIPRKTYEDRLKRAKEYQENLRGMKGTTPDDHKRAKEQVEELEKSLKTGKSIKIGDKEVVVEKTRGFRVKAGYENGKQVTKSVSKEVMDIVGSDRPNNRYQTQMKPSKSLSTLADYEKRVKEIQTKEKQLRSLAGGNHSGLNEILTMYHNEKVSLMDEIRYLKRRK